MMVVMLKLRQVVLKCVVPVESFQYLHSPKLTPWGSDYHCILVVLTEKGNHSLYLVLSHSLCVAENNGTGALNLIVEKLAKILHIHLALIGIYHSYRCAKSYTLTANTLNRVYNVAELAYAGGLYEYAVRMKFIQHLLQSLTKISHQTATDTP